MIVHLDKAQNKLLRWVCKAVATDESRPILTGVCVNGALVGCDGFRIHATKVPMGELQQAQGQTLRFGKIPATATVVDPTPVEHYSYPDYQVILPTTEADLEIGVNARYLTDALSLANGSKVVVRMRFRGPDKPIEVFGSSRDGQEFYSIIMPVQLSDGRYRVPDWRPQPPLPELETEEENTE